MKESLNVQGFPSFNRSTCRDNSFLPIPCPFLKPSMKKRPAVHKAIPFQGKDWKSLYAHGPKRKTISNWVTTNALLGSSVLGPNIHSNALNNPIRIGPEPTASKRSAKTNRIPAKNAPSMKNANNRANRDPNVNSLPAILMNFILKNLWISYGKHLACYIKKSGLMTLPAKAGLQLNLKIPLLPIQYYMIESVRMRKDSKTNTVNEGEAWKPRLTIL